MKKVSEMRVDLELTPKEKMDLLRILGAMSSIMIMRMMNIDKGFAFLFMGATCLISNWMQKLNEDDFVVDVSEVLAIDVGIHDILIAQPNLKPLVCEGTDKISSIAKEISAERLGSPAAKFNFTGDMPGTC